MNHVRIHGDPFGEDLAASQLRSFLRLAGGHGVRCSLSLSGVRHRRPQPGERAIPLTDGVRDWSTATSLPPAEVDLILAAAEACIGATAPVVVFADDLGIADCLTMVGLEWPRATAIVDGRGKSAAELLERLRGELRWGGCHAPAHARDEFELRRWLSLSPAVAARTIVHVAEDPYWSGSDLVVDAFARLPTALGLSLRIVIPRSGNGPSLSIDAVRRQRIEIVRGAFAPEHVADAVAIVQPYRSCRSTHDLVAAMASARPVAVARFASTAAVVDGRGVVEPIGGRYVRDDAAYGEHFEPHPSSVVAAIESLVSGRGAAGIAQRGRRHVVAELVRGGPLPPAPRVRARGERRPAVVLEAPLFEPSSSAELTIATAQALIERDQVDLMLVPNTPFRFGLDWLRARAPRLLPHLCRNPGDVDLWLSSGWPVRAARPACRTWALRVDWEYGALPHELTPHVTEDADVVVVHSAHVYRTITAAGRSMDSIRLVPHGVDACMHERATPDRQVMAFKGGRPAVLFCGGLIWRKGVDVFLGAVLEARRQGLDFVVVVKSVGGDQHYGNANFAELLQRFRDTPGTPPLLLIDRERTRAELASVYTACDVLLHPYRGEGFCMPVLEARACGLPVVATGSGATVAQMQGAGAFEIEADKVAVDLGGAHVSQPWVFEPRPESAAEKLTMVLQNLACERRAAGVMARAVRDAFSWSSAAASIEELAHAARGRVAVGSGGPDRAVVVPTMPPRPPIAGGGPALQPADR